MNKCKVIYPHKIVRPLGKYKINHKKQFDCFIKDILHNERLIKQYIADNPKRSMGRDCLCFSSSYPCEFCFRKGVRYQNPDQSSRKQQFTDILDHLQKLERKEGDFDKIRSEIEKTGKIMCCSRSHIVWPFSTYVGEARTHDNMLELANKVTQAEKKMHPDDAKGVVGKSPLFQIPHFDFVASVPPEYMHSVCLGVSKSMVKLTFNVGESWPRITRRKLSDPADFNKQMQNIKVLKEFSRKNRALDFSVMKAQEFRNIVLFFFPLIINCIEPKEKERKLWLQFAYMIRSCIVPQNEFKAINLESIYETCQNFYSLYERLFGPKNCTYNTHVVSSHLVEMRYHGPLTMTSAFGFESFYGELRNSFTPGTQNTLKQCLTKVLLKRILGPHCCENTIYFSPKETNLENNSLIYCFIDRTHKMFKIIDIQDDVLICKRQGRYQCSFPDLPNTNWSAVGVYLKGPLSSEVVEIMKENVHGKVIEVDKYFITCPNNVLREK